MYFRVISVQFLLKVDRKAAQLCDAMLKHLCVHCIFTSLVDSTIFSLNDMWLINIQQVNLFYSDKSVWNTKNIQIAHIYTYTYSERTNWGTFCLKHLDWGHFLLQAASKPYEYFTFLQFTRFSWFKWMNN